MLFSGVTLWGSGKPQGFNLSIYHQQTSEICPLPSLHQNEKPKSKYEANLIKEAHLHEQIFDFSYIRWGMSSAERLIQIERGKAEKTAAHFYHFCKKNAAAVAPLFAFPPPLAAYRVFPTRSGRSKHSSSESARQIEINFRLASLFCFLSPWGWLISPTSHTAPERSA